MSSILEALKKLETESEEPSEDVTWPQPLDTRSTLQGRLKKTGIGRYKGAIAAVVLALSCSGGVWFIMASKTDVADRSKDVTPPPSVTELADAPETEVFVPPREPVAHPSSKETIKAPSPVTADTMPPDSPPDETGQAVERDAEVTIAKETVPEPPVSAIPVTAVASVENDEAVVSRPGKLADSSWVTLHAISWSENPERRIAVINDSVVKIGRRVSGGVVRRIEKDFVVIEKDGEEYALVF